MADGNTNKYINHNLQYSATYIRSAISQDLLTALYNNIDTNDVGPVVLVALLHLLYSDCYDSIETLKSELNAIELKKYPGENVVDCCSDIVDKCERLDTAEAFSQDLLCKILCIFEASSERPFSDWAMKRYHDAQAQLKETRFHADLSAYKATLADPSTFITYQSLCKEAKTECRDLIGSNRYSAHVTSSDKQQDSPKIFQVIQSTVHKCLNSVLSSHGLTQKGSSNDTNASDDDKD